MTDYCAIQRNQVSTSLYRNTQDLLTYSMVQSPSWEANWFAASQEIPGILWNQKVHYRTHKRPPPVPTLCQPNSVHIPTSHHLEIHPNNIHPSTPRSPQWSLSLRFPHQDPIRPLSSPIRATCPAHLILLDFITGTILSERLNSKNSIRWADCFVRWPSNFSATIARTHTHTHITLAIVRLLCIDMFGM